MPGVYLNFFDQGYEFSNMQSITVSEDVQSAIATVKNILSESYIHVEQSKPGASCNELFDGFAGERILKVLDEEVAVQRR